MTVTVSSGAMRKNALGANTFPFDSATPAASSGTYAAIHKPAPIVALLFKKSRRASIACLAWVVPFAALMASSFLRPFPPRDESRGDCACKFRSDRYSQTWPHHYLCPLPWPVPHPPPPPTTTARTCLHP